MIVVTSMTPLNLDLETGHWTGVEFSLGNRPKQTLLGFHGFTGAACDFDILLSCWQGDCRFVAPNLPGHGSELKAKYRNAPGWIVGLGDFANATIEGEVTVIGYSLGARLALHFALMYPERVQALILIGGTAGIEDELDRQQRRASDEDLASWIEHNGVAAFRRRWRETPIIATQASIPSPYGEAIQERKQRLTSGGLASALRTVGPGTIESVWNRLGEIHMPTLVVSGEKDIKYCRIAHELSCGLPRGEMRVVAAAGHAAHLEASDESAAIIGTFLSALKGTQDKPPSF